MADEEHFPPRSAARPAGRPHVKHSKAVALEYDKSKAPAPRVIASGQGHVADQILAIAFANNVKVREDADLVEILSVLDVDSMIPLEAFAAVGEILSYIYRANGKAMKQKNIQ